MHLDALARNAECSGHRFRGCSRDLRGRPEFARITANVGGAIDRLHRGVSEEGHFVDSFDFVCSGCMSLVEVAVVADDSSRLGSKPQHFFAEAGGGFGSWWRFVPVELEKLAGLHSGPRAIDDD